MSRLPMLAMHWRARLTWIGFRDCRSFFILWIISLIRSLFTLTNTEINKYPCKEIKRWVVYQIIISRLLYTFPSSNKYVCLYKCPGCHFYAYNGICRTTETSTTFSCESGGSTSTFFYCSLVSRQIEISGKKYCLWDRCRGNVVRQKLWAVN